MGRLKDKLERKNILQPNQPPNIQYPEPPIPPMPEYIPEEEILAQQRQMHPDEYYEQYPPQPPQQQYQEPINYDTRRIPMPEPDYQQQVQQQIEERSPLSILDEINERPSEKGTHPIQIGGRPIDLHVLEDYVVKISPYSLRTILRYHNARTIEEMKGYSKGVGLKMSSGTIILIMLIIGMAIVGILMMTMFPDMMQGISNAVP